MAIRFDDRIETNVAGDVLITGDQIKIGTQTINLSISSNDVSINNETFHIDGTNVIADKLVELPYAINKVNECIINIATKICDFVSRNTNKNKVNIDTTTKYFGDKLKITSATELQDYIAGISTNLKEKPVITFLSSPIVFSTHVTNGNIIYGTMEHPFGNPNIKMLPKNTLVYLFSNDTHLDNVEGVDTQGISTNVSVMLLKNFMKVLSIPVSADDIHNDFENRITNIENLLALK